MKSDAFDCVEIKRRGARRITRETARMTPEEEVAYWQERSEAFRRWQKSARKTAPTAATPPPKPEPKAFDCVEMMHQGGKAVEEMLAGMTLEEQLAYWSKANRDTAKERDPGQARRKKA